MQSIKVPSWALALGSIVAALVGLTILVLGAGLLLVIVPVLIVVGLFARWRIKNILRKAQQAQPSRYPDAIEGEFTVIEDTRRRGPDDRVQPRR